MSKLISALLEKALDDILDASTRNQVGAHNLVELVRLTNRVREAPRDVDDEGALSSEYMEEISVGRERIAEFILEGAQERAGDYGIELLDVRIKRINYVDSVRQSVYQRMKAERNR